MKKSTALAAAALLGGVFATPALAQDNQSPPQTDSNSNTGFYAGGGINLYFIDKGDAAEGLPIAFIDQPSPGAFLGRLGYSFNEYFAVEVEAGFGGAKSEFEGGGFNLDIGVAGPVGAHLAVSMPLGAGGGYLMGKAGYSSITVERELNGVQAPDIEISGASFGVGGGLRSESWDLRAEYGFMSGDADSGVLGLFALHRF